MSSSPIVHCHFMLHFYERINDDDDDDGESCVIYSTARSNKAVNIANVK